MDCINRQELTRMMANRVDGLSQRLAGAALQAALECMVETLGRGGVVRLSDFGTFSLRKRQTRSIQHPRTREVMNLPECMVPVFTPAPSLRAHVSSING
jgi:DNA-binding protein HU-beta